MLKAFSRFVVIVFLLCAGITFVHAEQIDSFNSKIQVQNDGTLQVIETIIYNPQDAPRHGLLRDIPLQNAQGGSMQILNISITDGNGTPYQFTRSGSGTISFKIGNPNVTFGTPKTYVISYTIAGAYSYFQDFDEIYWNATGNDWVIPIVKASAEVDLPIGVSPLQSACYVGVSGSKNSCNSSLGIFVAPTELNPGEGLTVAVGFAKGVVPPEVLPPNYSYLWILTLLIAPIVAFFWLFQSWRRKWRAPKGTGVIIAQYDAPQGFTPMEVAGALSETVAGKAISAEIIYLATKGFIKITQTESKFLIFTSKDYELQKLKEIDESLSSQDKLLMDCLFAGHSVVKLSGLKNTFYVFVAAIGKAILEGLTAKGFFRDDFRKTKVWLKLLGILLIIASVFLGSFFQSLLAWLIGGVAAAVTFFVGIAIAGIIAFIFSIIISTRTAEGVAIKEWILGFKEYLQIAEKDRINFHNAPEKKPEIFEKFLPYAMVLGVEKAWAKEFEGIYTTPPSWYSGPSGAAFSAVVFTNSLGSFNTMAASSLSSAPGGGSGGGGSSGGGGGGGGGGGW